MPLLKPAEAAEYLGICEKILVRHVDAGDLLAVDVGRGAKKRRLRYDPADLDAFIAKRKSAARECQSGNKKTAFINSISNSNVVDIMERLASGQSAPPRLLNKAPSNKPATNSKS